MNEKLQQAIAAARNGQAVEAQLLLTQVLKEDPNETQAWFLLSTLVDSEQKKTAYLGKVLALEPDHQMAQKMLARLQVPEPAAVEAEVEVESVEPAEDAGLETEQMTLPDMAPISSSTADFLAQEKGDTLPEWMLEEEGIEPTERVQADVVEETTTAAVPDWLQDEVPESWSEESLEAEEPVIEIATDKVDSEIPAPEDGVIKKILFLPKNMIFKG